MKIVKLHKDVSPWVRLIYNEMIAQDLNISQLSELSGISRHTIRYWFTRACEPGITSVFEVLQALGYELRAHVVPISPGLLKIRQRQQDRRIELNEEISRRNRLGLMGSRYVLSVTPEPDSDTSSSGIRADDIPELAEFASRSRRRNPESREAH